MISIDTTIITIMDDCNFIHYNFEELVLLFYYLHFWNGYSSSNVATSNLEIDQYVKKKRETEERIIIMIRSFVLVIFIIFRDISNDKIKCLCTVQAEKGDEIPLFWLPCSVLLI